MRVFGGKEIIVTQGPNSFYLVRLSSSTCDCQGHYGKERENGGAHVGLEVAFEGFFHIPLGKTQCHGLRGMQRKCVLRRALDGFGEHRTSFLPLVPSLPTKELVR